MTVSVVSTNEKKRCYELYYFAYILGLQYNILRFLQHGKIVLGVYVMAFQNAREQAEKITVKPLLSGHPLGNGGVGVVESSIQSNSNMLSLREHGMT